jgi:hypothetical protein
LFLQAVISLLTLNKKESSSPPLLSLSSSSYDIEQTLEAINAISENLSRFLIDTAKSYEKTIVNHADERIIYEIYRNALNRLLKVLKDGEQLHNISRGKQLIRPN